MKKILSLVLALMMLLSCFSVFAESLEMSDVENMTAPGVLPIVVDPVQLEMAITTSTHVLDYDDNWTTKRTEEETGIDIVWNLLPSAETATVVDLMLASGDELPDVFVYQFGTKTAGYAAEGYFQEITDYYDKDNGYAHFFWNANGMTERDYDIYFKRIKETDGKIYGYGSFVDALGDIPRITQYVNMEWLNALGLEVPTTKEEFYDVLVAFRDKDPNGNGQPDEIPMIGATYNGDDLEFLINMFIYWNPEQYLNVENDVVYAPFTTKEWQEAMIFTNKLYSEKLLSELTFSITTDEMISLLQSYDNKHQIIGFMTGMFTTSAPDPTATTALAYEILDPLEGQYTPERSPWVNKTAFITADCETPEIAFRLFDYFGIEKNSLAVRYGEPNVHWMYRADDPAAFDEMFVLAQRSEAAGYEAVHGTLPVTSPWVSENNTIWNCHMGTLLPLRTYSGNGTTSKERVDSWEEGVALGDPTTYKNYLSARNTVWTGKLPAQVFDSPIYSLEETDKYNDIMTQCKSYVTEAIASFTTGQMDPVADWDAYLANLESAGLSQWLELAQTYWNRSK